MKSINRAYLLVLIAFFIIILVLLALLFYGKCCKNVPVASRENRTISWNILFKEGTPKIDREEVIRNIQQYARDFHDNQNAAANTDIPFTDHVATCPCDTLLYNYDFLSIFGAGPPVTTAQTQQRTTASGHVVDVIISNNIPMKESLKGKEKSPYTVDSILLFGKTIDESKILAIIDSGIDSTRFTPSFLNLIWKDNFPTATIFNFLPYQLQSDVFDGTEGKHGSAVASIAIKTMENTARYPKLMILKALDNNNEGSVFSVSCALSYAIQKKATVVNLSLGYQGDDDSILHHYMTLTTSPVPAIDVFAAAGNLPAPHQNSNLCLPNNGGQLSKTRLFFPACFSTNMENVTSVTQVSTQYKGCYYQNYSNEYIKLGVLDSSNCCAIKVDFLREDNYYEGSSFATPVASGIKMNSLLNAGDWNSLIKTDTRLNNIVFKGRYIGYASKR